MGQRATGSDRTTCYPVPITTPGRKRIETMVLTVGQPRRLRPRITAVGPRPHPGLVPDNGSGAVNPPPGRASQWVVAGLVDPSPPRLVLGRIGLPPRRSAWRQIHRLVPLDA